MILRWISEQHLWNSIKTLYNYIEIYIILQSMVELDPECVHQVPRHPLYFGFFLTRPVIISNQEQLSVVLKDEKQEIREEFLDFFTPEVE